LLIALTGYGLIRFVFPAEAASHSYSQGKKRSDDFRGGHWAILVLIVGALLSVIGYVGAVLGTLIKSAICRQREFLADASAVQFTRNPAGLAGALKKIGGMPYGSLMRSGAAAELSHMFFGAGLRRSILLFSTHPPLTERIRRLDPTFDGHFEQTAPIRAFTSVEPPRPATDARKARSEETRAMRPAKPALAPLEPEAAVAAIGAPTAEHLAYAAALKESMPQSLVRLAHEPAGAKAVIFALMLNESDAVRAAQIELVGRQGLPDVFAALESILPELSALAPEARLPLMALAVPALRRMDAEQFDRFSDNMYAVAAMDGRINVFEYAVHRMLKRHVAPAFVKSGPAKVHFYKIAPVLRECGELLSTLAHFGRPDDAGAARRSFDQGVDRLGDAKRWIQMTPAQQCGIPLVEKALARLAHAAPKVKRTILAACAACVRGAGHVTVRQAELLRAIADALECPMPPLLPGEQLRPPPLAGGNA
jgi:hypothetical protein